jgi:hypothetical protein
MFYDRFTTVKRDADNIKPGLPVMETVLAQEE